MVYRLPNSRVGTASTDVAAHCHVDIGIGGVGNALQEPCRAHYLARLTVAALSDVQFPPRDLDGVIAILGQTLDRRDLGAFNCR